MTKSIKIPFSPPHISEEAIKMVSEVLRSGWITTGPLTKKFERNLSKYSGADSTLCVSAATTGLELMLRWFGVGNGDEVILPAYTYCATANVIMHCGATPVLVDVNRDDFNISIKAIQRAISPATKVIMPVDIGGLPCNYDEINEVVRIIGITPKNAIQEMLGRPLVLSDAAHSVGAHYDGSTAGSLTDISVFSFHAVKNLTTAEGGAVSLKLPETFNANEIYAYLNTMSLHGQSKDALAKTNSPGWKYDVIEAGYKCNMTDIQAAIGLSQLNHYTEILNKRKAICVQYKAQFEKYPWAELPVLQDKKRESSYHLFMLRIRDCNEGERNAIIEKIFASGVAVNVHFQPLPLLSAYSLYNMSDYPIAFDNYSKEISLPVYYDLMPKQVDFVVDVVVKAVTSIID